MKDRKELLSDALSEIDDSLLAEALDTDSAEKLAALTNRKTATVKSKKIKYVSVLAACIALAALLIIGTIGGSMMLDKAQKPVTSDTEPPAGSVDPPQSSVPPTTNPPSPPGTTDTPGIIEPGDTKIIIDSFDKVNYYAAHKLLADNGYQPLGAAVLAGDKYVITTVINFFINVTEEHEYLAEKIGTGRVEVIISNPNEYTDINRAPGRAMITFKKGEKYYTCRSRYPLEGSDDVIFTANRYIEGYMLYDTNGPERAYSFTFKHSGEDKSTFRMVYGYRPQLNYLDSTIYTEIEIDRESIAVAHGSYTFSFASLSEYYKAEFSTGNGGIDPFVNITMDDQKLALIKSVVEVKTPSGSKRTASVDIPFREAIASDEIQIPTFEYEGWMPIIKGLNKNMIQYSDGLYKIKEDGSLKQYYANNFEMSYFDNDPIQGEWYIVFTLELGMDVGTERHLYRNTYLFKLVIAEPFGKPDASEIPPDCNALPEDFPVETFTVTSEFGKVNPMIISMYAEDSAEPMKWQLATGNDIKYIVAKHKDIPILEVSMGEKIEISNGGRIVNTKVYFGRDPYDPQSIREENRYRDRLTFFFDNYKTPYWAPLTPRYFIEATVEWESEQGVRRYVYLFECDCPELRGTFLDIDSKVSVSNGSNTVSPSVFKADLTRKSDYDDGVVIQFQGRELSSEYLTSYFSNVMSVIEYSDSLSIDFGGGSVRSFKICYRTDTGELIEETVSDISNWQSYLPDRDCYVFINVFFQGALINESSRQSDDIKCVFKIDRADSDPPLFEERPIVTFDGDVMTVTNGEDSINPIIIKIREKYYDGTSTVVKDLNKIDRYELAKYAGSQVPTITYSDYIKIVAEGYTPSNYSLYGVYMDKIDYAMTTFGHSSYGDFDNSLSYTLEEAKELGENKFYVAFDIVTFKDDKTITYTYFFAVTVPDEYLV